jgi:hypothetical protein
MNFPDPPSAMTGPLRDYLQKVASTFRTLPVWSYASLNDPNSAVTGKVGDYFTIVGSASTFTRVWHKIGPENGTASTTSWVMIQVQA